MNPTGSLSVTAAELATGDALLRVGGVGFAQLLDNDAPPVLVAEARPPLEDAEGDPIVEILTSAGTLYARDSAPALVRRDNTISGSTILLISRRRSLHARMCEIGVPIVRRTPVRADASATEVTRQEWHTAPLIVVDGYLAASTLRSMWLRGDLSDRDQIVMVATDPDDVNVFARQEMAHARAMILLPYERSTLVDLFHAATTPGGNYSPYLGILTPQAPA